MRGVLGTGAKRWLPALGVLAALVPSLVMWGFTVDDALIPVRYAQHVASGVGYRFSAHAAASDGVTPLPWAFLLVPLSRGDALDVLVRAKVLGAVAWVVAAAALARRLVTLKLPSVTLMLPLVTMALAFEIGAWAAGGLETGLVTALVTLAAVNLDRPRRAAALAGVAAAFRPELVVWALVLAGANRDTRTRTRDAFAAAALALGPFAACVVVRLALFGRPVPLAVLAKPSDFAHGATYAVAAAVVLLLPLLALAPVAIAKTPAARALALAFVAHLLAVAAAGGDWMPYARLVVPVAPSLVIVFAESADRSPRALVLLRAAAALVLGALVAWRAAPAGRHVTEDRAALVHAARPALASSHVVAALDVGWVSASTDADIVDLAGLTDPAIALLPGGHTSKRVDVAMLLDRDVDTVVVYGQPRVVEERLLRTPLFHDRFEPRETLPLGYTLWRRK